MLYDGDTFEYNGLTFTFKTERDDSADSPWDMCEPLGEVSDWNRRTKEPGEVIIAEDRGSRRFYDMRGAVKAGRKEGMTGPQAVKAANAECERFRLWYADRWEYIGVIVTYENHTESLWGIESDCGDYLTEVAHELAAQICHDIGVESDLAADAAKLGIATVPDCACLQSFAQN